VATFAGKMMCGIYSKADPIHYESRSRSVRIHGVVTSLRLENLFWEVLAEIARNDGITTNQLIAKLYDEIIEYLGDVPNLASFLRVSCLRYLALSAGRESSVLKSASPKPAAPAAKLVDLAPQQARRG
jgi:predicted DNA-binding ribbon-helix-helix protein